MSTEISTEMNTEMNSEESFSLDGLLRWLDDDPDEAGRKYVRFHQELTVFLMKNDADTVAEALADEALNRVNKHLANSFLSEHFNSTEIADVPNLCRILYKEKAKNSPGLSGRIWRFLSSADQSLVAAVAQEGDFGTKQRSNLSRALNELLRRTDFYRAEDFDLNAFGKQTKKSPIFEKIEVDIARGLTRLSQSEIERFNRRLLEAAYPKIIKRNLADTEDGEKLARCKAYARTVLLEYNGKTPDFISTSDDSGNFDDKINGRKETSGEWFDPIGEQISAEEKREKLECLRKCTAKLSPRDSELFSKYYTGITIREPDDDPLVDRAIKAIRKALPSIFGVAPDTVRPNVFRSKKKVLNCIENCLKDKQKN